ncbi:hypothetical protein ACHAW6_005139 [Cyclotella cf. meneghiniana]
MSSMNTTSNPCSTPELPPHSSDPNIELPRVLLALQTVYAPSLSSTTTPNDAVANAFSRRDLSDRYLTSFQRLPVAWIVCDRLLLSPHAGDSSHPPPDAMSLQQRQFFAAQTLHSKCQSDVHQLPPESLGSLRDSLSAHFTRHASESVAAAMENRPSSARPLVTRLGMALAALAVQLNWTGVFQDVSQLLLTRPELTCAVLELFRSVPEEVGSGRLVLASGEDDDLTEFRTVLRSERGAGVVLALCEEAVRRSCGYRQQMEKQHDSRGEAMEGGDVNPSGYPSFITPTHHNQDVATTEAVLSCLQSWIRIVDMPPSLLQHSILLPWMFEYLLTDSANGGYEMAVDVVVELLRSYTSERDENSGLITAIVPKVMTLGGIGSVNSGGQEGRGLSPFEKAIREEDEDGMRGYCRIFTEMGEAYLSLILSHEELNQEVLVELVLKCASIPDKEIAGITLHFWYKFVMGLEDLEPYEYRQIKIDTFAPQLVRLLAIFTSLLRFPVGVEDLSSDRVDDIEGIRLYFADTLEDCCRLLGGEAVLQTVGGPLQEECRRVSSLPAHQQLSQWHGIEAYFYAIQALSMYVPSDENRVMPFVMGLIPQLPPEVPLLRATACQTVGRYASWLGNHPSYLQPLLPYLAQGLSIPRCASASAVAIREISERCSSLDDALMQLYDGIVVAREQHRAAGSTGDDFILDIKNELAVLEGVCKAVSNKLKNHPSLNSEVMNGYINRLVQPIIANLKVLASPGFSSSPKQLSSEICRLTVLVQHLILPRASSYQQSPNTLNRSDFILSLMRETWPMLDVISQKHPRDFVLSEKLCRLHKHAIRECGPPAYTPMLDSLIQQIVANFSQSLSSPYLYLASVCITEYGRNPSHAQQMFNMVANLSSAVFQTLRTTEDFTAHPDVVEEFFYMAGRMMNICPDLLVQSNLLNSLLQCAAIGMKLSHRDANKGTLNFLESTVSYSLQLRSNRAADANDHANMAALERAIVADGQPLVINLAQALLGELPASRLDSGSGSIAGVLFYLNQLCPDLLMQWIQPPLVSAPEHAKSAFLGALQNRVTRDEFNWSVRKFTSVCERNRKRQAGTSGDEFRTS